LVVQWSPCVPQIGPPHAPSLQAIEQQSSARVHAVPSAAQ
jgi:hypothetical protein